MADGADVSTPPQRFLSAIFAASGVLGLVSAVSQLVDYFQSGKYAALLWTFAFLVLVVLSTAGVAWRNRVGAFLGRISGLTRPAQWIYPALAIVFVVAAILWSGLVSLGVTDRSWKGGPSIANLGRRCVASAATGTAMGGQLRRRRPRPQPLAASSGLDERSGTGGCGSSSRSVRMTTQSAGRSSCRFHPVSLLDRSR